MSSKFKLLHQLTQQLEDLRKGRLQLHSLASPQGAPNRPQGRHTGMKASPLSSPAAIELKKFYQELQVIKHCAFVHAKFLTTRKDISRAVVSGSKPSQLGAE